MKVSNKSALVKSVYIVNNPPYECPKRACGPKDTPGNTSLETKGMICSVIMFRKSFAPPHSASKGLPSLSSTGAYVLLGGVKSAERRADKTDLEST